MGASDRTRDIQDPSNQVPLLPTARAHLTSSPLFIGIEITTQLMQKTPQKTHKTENISKTPVLATVTRQARSIQRESTKA